MLRLTQIGLAALVAWLSLPARAATVQILYRPSLRMVWRSLSNPLHPNRGAIIEELAQSPESLGHVAIFLPGDGVHAPQIIGWEPKISGLPPSHPLLSSEKKIAYEWILRNPIKGEFQDNGRWALAGIYSSHTKTMALPIEVTDAELLQMRARVTAMNRGAEFHFQLNIDAAKLKPFHFNCVGAITYLLRVTSIPCEFFPSQTDCFEDYVQELSVNIRPWRACAEFIREIRNTPKE